MNFKTNTSGKFFVFKGHLVVSIIQKMTKIKNKPSRFLFKINLDIHDIESASRNSRIEPIINKCTKKFFY